LVGLGPVDVDTLGFAGALEQLDALDACAAVIDAAHGIVSLKQQCGPSHGTLR
jgi:hypothetical protein